MTANFPWVSGVTIRLLISIWQTWGNRRIDHYRLSRLPDNVIFSVFNARYFNFKTNNSRLRKKRQKQTENNHVKKRNIFKTKSRWPYQCFLHSIRTPFENDEKLEWIEIMAATHTHSFEVDNRYLTLLFFFFASFI